MVKGREERITSPPAMLARISSAARVIPREATDNNATREVMSIPRLPITMIAVIRYRTALMAESRYFCIRTSSLERDNRRRAALVTIRTASRQISSVARADKAPRRETSKFLASSASCVFMGNSFLWDSSPCIGIVALPWIGADGP